MVKIKKQLIKMFNIIAEIIFDVIWYSSLLWLVINLFLFAFKISFRMTYIQAIAVFLLYAMMNVLLGIGDKE